MLLFSPRFISKYHRGFFSIGHTVCYAYALMPHRSLFFMAGVFCVFAMTVNAALGSFQ
jgi:hypothetical protein